MTTRDHGAPHRIGGIVLCSAIVAVLQGCVLPGSSLGRVSIRGSLRTEEGRPLPDREVLFFLPAEYGLGGVDLVLGDPEDYGHRGHSFSITTDSQGEFSYDLGQRVYHVNVWLIPPL